MFMAPASKRFSVTSEQFKSIVSAAQDNPAISNLKFSDIGDHSGQLTVEGEIDLSFVYDGVGSLLVSVDKKHDKYALVPSSLIFDKISRVLLTIVPPPPAPGQVSVKVPIKAPEGVTSGYPHVLEGPRETAIPGTGIEATSEEGPAAASVPPEQIEAEHEATETL